MRKVILAVGAISAAMLAAAFLPMATAQQADDRADRRLVEEKVFADELAGTVSVFVEADKNPIVVGKYEQRLRVSDKEFLIFQDVNGKDKVIVRTQNIVAMRISPAK